MLIPLNLLEITSFTSIQSNFALLTIGALLLSGAIVVVWYFAGVLLQNNGVKASARSEFYQLMGTVVMAIAIVGVLVTFSSAFYGSLGATSLLKPAAVSTMCHQLAQTSQLQLLQAGPGSLLAQPQIAASGPPSGGPLPFMKQQEQNIPYNGLCILADTPQQGKPTLTSQLDYPLASTGIVIANLTNQTASNLNQSYVVDSFLGFLQGLSPTTYVCIGLPPPSVQCLFPTPVSEPVQFELKLNFTPYKGYQLLTDNMNSLSSLLTTSLESFVAQLVFISVFLFMWPYLLFIGIVLRSNFFTRKLGGLLMAIAIGMVMFFPAVYSIEYLALGNGLPAGQNSAYLYSTTTALPSSPLPSDSSNYNLNFFVQPSIKTIAMHNLCWPETVGLGGKPSSIPLTTAEFYDIGYLLIPFTSIIATVASFTGSTIPSSIPLLSLPASCEPAAALNTFYAILNAYGIVGITAFWLPILNLFITISAILGLSGLLGGDTTLGGLEKLI